VNALDPSLVPVRCWECSANSESAPWPHNDVADGAVATDGGRLPVSAEGLGSFRTPSEITAIGFVAVASQNDTVELP